MSKAGKKANFTIIQPGETSTRRKKMPPQKKQEAKDKEVAIPTMCMDLENMAVAESMPKEKYVDLTALLSGQDRDFLITAKAFNKVPLSSLLGKYVIVLCPKDMSPIYATCYPLEALYTQLSSQGIADTVPGPEPNYTGPRFFSFFTHLSANYLTIPYDDHDSRHRIYQYLGYKGHLVLHPNGSDLQVNGFFLESYGAQSFPFTKGHFDRIKQQDVLIHNRICSSDSYPPIFAKELLQCDYLSRIADQNDSIPTSELDNRYVGLYLCFNGCKMDTIRDIHKKCVDQRLEFEIILVPLPYDWDSDPITQCNLLKQRASSSWWEFPYDDKICRTLWRLVFMSRSDYLIILPHGDRRGDLSGLFVASCYGIDAYPFTKDVIVEKELSELRSLTLRTLLGDTLMSKWELGNQNVLLDIDYPSRRHGDGATLINCFHPVVEGRYPDCKVVFVPLQPISSTLKYDRLPEMTLPADKCEYVMRRIFMSNHGCGPEIVSFGKDGNLLSRCVADRLARDASASPFEDTLRSEIFGALNKLASDWEG